MSLAQSVLFVFLAGLTLCGLSATVLELLTGARTSFAHPLLRRDRLAVSMIATAVAGPAMLINDALKARSFGRAGNRELLAAAAVSIVWLLSLGVLLIEFVLLIARS